MSKEYGYFEAMQEIMNDKSKKFIRDISIYTLEYDNTSKHIILNWNNNSMETIKPVIDDNWVKTKWILIEDKRSYNVRVYNVSDDRLISSENLITTQDEIRAYCKSKVILGEVKKIRDRSNTLFIIREMNKTRVEYEEIITI